MTEPDDSFVRSRENVNRLSTPPGAIHEPERPIPAAGSAAIDPEAYPGLHSGFGEAPPYRTATNNIGAESNIDMQTAHEFPALHRLPSHATHTSHGQHSTRSHGIAQSFRSLMHGSVRRSHRDSSQIKEESDEDKSASSKAEEEAVETPEELSKKQQDPQHLLNTILEEPEPGSGESMVQLGDMAAEVSSAAGLSTDSSIQSRRKGYRENLLRNRRLRRYTKTSRRIAWLRTWYNKIMNSSLLIRLFVWWLPLALILFVPLAVGAFHNRDMRLGGTRVMWIFIWLEVVWAALFVTKVLAHYLPEAFAFLISILMPRFFKFVNMFVSLELPIQLLLWTFLSFITFSPILNDNKDANDSPDMPHWQLIIQDILVALLVSAIVFLCEQIFLYFLSTNFHRTRMSLRIQAHKKAMNTLIILLDFAYKFFPFGSDEFEEEDRALYFHNMERAQRRSQKSKLTKFKGFQNINKAMHNAAKNMTKFVSDFSGAQQPPAAKTVKNAMSSKETAVILAERIWKSLVTEDSDALTYEDLMEVFGEDRKEEVLYMFDVLDKDGNQGIELEEMRQSLIGINREGKAIARSLVDLDGAIKKLHHLLLFLCLIIVIIIFVGMLAPSSSSVLATLGSTLLSMSWLFSATAQEVFNSCIFLFVKHPFDVGDWVLAVVPGEGGGGTTRLRVVELNLMYTVFWSVGLNIRIQTSNAVLNTMWIENITRSPPSQIAIDIVVGIPETRYEQLAELEYRINEFVEDNPRDYSPGIYFQTGALPDLDRLKVSICINTRMNQDDVVAFARRRTKATHFLARCISEVGIMVPRRTDNTYTDPSLPLFQYNVHSADEAMEFGKRTRGLRKPYGMLPPLAEFPSHVDPADIDGFVDGEVEQEGASVSQEQQQPQQPLHGHFQPFVADSSFVEPAATNTAATATGFQDAANTSGVTRRPRGASMGSHFSRASSSASQAARGLRSRRTPNARGPPNFD